MTFSDLSPYCVLPSYRLIRDCGPGKKFPHFAASWAAHPVNLLAGSLWATLRSTGLPRMSPRCYDTCFAGQCTFHAILVLFTVQGDSAESLLSLISHSSAFQCIFRCSGSKPLTFFLLFWRGLLTCCLHSVSFSEVFLLHWEEHTVHVHSFYCSCLCCLEKTNFP